MDKKPRLGSDPLEMVRMENKEMKKEKEATKWNHYRLSWGLFFFSWVILFCLVRQRNHLNQHLKKTY